MARLNGHDDEVAELLGAYALDALDRDEAARVEAHLETCPRCRAELADHREVAGLLGHAGQEAPAGVWDRIVTAMQEPPPAMRLTRVEPFPPASSPLASSSGASSSGAAASAGRRRWAAPVAALAVAAVLAVAVLGIQALRGNDRGAGPSGSMAAVRQALAAPGARRVVLAPNGGAKGSLDAVVLPDGQGYLYNDTLTPLGSAQTYQLWGILGVSHVSYGLLGSSPQPVQAFQAAPKVQELAVTAEVAGGVVASSHAPVALGTVPPPPRR